MALRAHFVSDLHLWDLGDERAQVFLGYLGQRLRVRDLSHLFLVGDIFDLWVSDRKVFVTRFAPIVEAIRKLRQAGVEIHYFEGNHDLHLKRYWHDQMGCQVHEGPKDFQLGMWRVRVEHGDQIDLTDLGYLALRWTLRTKPVKLIGQTLPGYLVRWIGEKASAKSREYTSGARAISGEEIRQRLHGHAERIAKLTDRQILVHGHVHVFDRYETEGRTGMVTSINLGSWLNPPYRVLELTDSGLSVVLG